MLRLKMAVLAPTPRANTAMTAQAKPGDLRGSRQDETRSAKREWIGANPDMVTAGSKKMTAGPSFLPRAPVVPALRKIARRWLTDHNKYRRLQPPLSPVRELGSFVPDSETVPGQAPRETM